MADKPVEATVQTVLEGPNNWNDKDIYVVMFADRSEKHSFFVPEGDDPPVEDGVEKGWFGEKKNGEPKFSRASDRAPSQRSSNGSSGDPPDRFDRKPDHPQTQERMRHTTALSAAPAYYQLLREEGVQDKPADKAEMLNTLSGLILWLEGTYPVPEA